MSVKEIDYANHSECRNHNFLTDGAFAATDRNRDKVHMDCEYVDNSCASINIAVITSSLFPIVWKT